MSKKSKRAARQTQAAGRQPAQRTVERRGGGRAGRGREPEVNLGAVRAVTAVLGFLCLAGAVGIFFRVQAPYSPAVIVEVILLAFIAGLCAFGAARPRAFVEIFKRITR